MWLALLGGLGLSISVSTVGLLGAIGVQGFTKKEVCGPVLVTWVRLCFKALGLGFLLGCRPREPSVFKV